MSVFVGKRGAGGLQSMLQPKTDITFKLLGMCRTANG